MYEFFGQAPQTLKVHGRTQALIGDFNNELAVEATLFQLQQLYRLDKIETLSLMPRLESIGLGAASPTFRRQLQLGTTTPASLRTLSSTYLYYRYDVYQGFFTHFNWSQDAESPRVYEYDFEYMVTATAQNMLADSLFIPTTVKQAAISTAIGLAASAPALVNIVKGFTTLGQDITNGLGSLQRNL